MLWLFLAAMVVDGTDGMLARRLPGQGAWCREFDGALLDNIVDYLTYAFAPMVLLWATGYLPDGAWGGVVAALPLVASCYQFCRTDAKTDDHFFLGFPSYWNIVAFYVVVFDLGDGRDHRGPAGADGADLRAGQVRLPLAHRDALVHQHGAGDRVAGRLRRHHRAAARRTARADALSLAYLAYYVGISLWLTFWPPNVKKREDAVAAAEVEPAS